MATKAKKMRKPAAPTPPSRRIEDKAQYERFRQFAREHGADDNAEVFDRQFRKLITSRPLTK